MSDYELKPDEPDPGPPPPATPFRPPAPPAHPAGPRRGVHVPSVVPFALGLFASLGLCAGTFILFASTYKQPLAARRLYFFGALAAFVGLFLVRGPLQQRWGFTGFGRGIFIGMMLGMIALFPCAGWYALRLFEE